MNQYLDYIDDELKKIRKRMKGKLFDHQRVVLNARRRAFKEMKDKYLQINEKETSNYRDINLKNSMEYTCSE